MIDAIFWQHDHSRNPFLSEEDATDAEGQDEGETKTSEQNESEEKQASGPSVAETATNIFSSAVNGFGLMKSPSVDEKQLVVSNASRENQETASSAAVTFSSALTTLGNFASGAQKTLKEKVGNNNMLAEFNKEQENFIKSKGTYKENQLAQSHGEMCF